MARRRMDDGARPLKDIKRVPHHSVASHSLPQCDMAGLISLLEESHAQ